MKTGLIVIVMGAWLALGCGSTPSKSDICGSCKAESKSACEQVYDACKDDDDCLDKLEDAKPCG